MHRLRYHSTIRRLRLAAFLFCAKWILIPATVGLVVHSMFVQDEGSTIIGAAGIALTALVAILQSMAAATAHCPMCMTPLIASKDSVKHRRSSAFLGSHSLHVALAIIFKNTFRCPYCNEITALKSQGRRKH